MCCPATVWKQFRHLFFSMPPSAFPGEIPTGPVQDIGRPEPSWKWDESLSHHDYYEISSYFLLLLLWDYSSLLMQRRLLVQCIPTSLWVNESHWPVLYRVIERVLSNIIQLYCSLSRHSWGWDSHMPHLYSSVLLLPCYYITVINWNTVELRLFERVDISHKRPKREKSPDYTNVRTMPLSVKGLYSQHLFMLTNFF